MTVDPHLTAFRYIRAFLLFLLGSALFAGACALAPLYYSNQNQYFLHGLANAGVGLLNEDWLAKTHDPTLVFSALVTVTVRFLHPFAFYLYYGLLLGVYAAAMLGLFRFLADGPAAGRLAGVRRLLRRRPFRGGAVGVLSLVRRRLSVVLPGRRRGPVRPRRLSATLRLRRPSRRGDGPLRPRLGPVGRCLRRPVGHLSPVLPVACGTADPRFSCDTGGGATISPGGDSERIHTDSRRAGDGAHHPHVQTDDCRRFRSISGHPRQPPHSAPFPT